MNTTSKFDSSLISNQSRKMSKDLKTDIPNEVVEEQTKKIPNLLFLWLSVGSIAASTILRATNQRALSKFVGLWVPAFLAFGLYNKIVKLEDEILRVKMH